MLLSPLTLSALYALAGLAVALWRLSGRLMDSAEGLGDWGLMLRFSLELLLWPLVLLVLALRHEP
jgi:hypothetical protein